MNIGFPSQRNLMRGVFLLFAATGLLLSSSNCLAQANDMAQGGGTKTRTVEIPFTSHDGYEMFGKLTIPNDSALHPMVIYVQNAEASTVDMKRRDPRGGN